MTEETIPLADTDVEEELKSNLLLGSVADVLNWARSSSLWPVTGEVEGPGRCSTDNTHSDTILCVTNVSERVHRWLELGRAYRGPCGCS